MPDFRSIYAQHADHYDRLVEREDFHHNLLPSLRSIAPAIASNDACRVVEFGAGTGRLTRMLAPLAASVTACDRSEHMLRYAAERLKRRYIDNVALVVAENEHMPIADQKCELAIAGWSLGHSTDWFADRWQAVIGAALDEMWRVLAPGGTAIVIETLGTGTSEPRAPSERLQRYYDWLEQALGWRSIWIRTDYRFASQAEADELTTFFFGQAMPWQLDSQGRA
ncbi:MAG TPA: class I SAM-dependent methyltransferase, partial [Roseiflexaceae bacterium]|nr:class I SAM-dependent methyltransferase [Roseiflexaceae bacterium]